MAKIEGIRIRNFRVLRDVTFSLQKGEKMGLVGVNGSGKTTLMRLLTGEEQPDGGS